MVDHGLYALRDQIMSLCHSRGRVFYRALKWQFDLDDEDLEEMKADRIYAQHVAAEDAGRVLGWTGGTASEVQEVAHARGIQMSKKRKAPTDSKGGGAPSGQAEQGNLWLEPHTRHPHERIVASSAPQPADTLRKPPSRQSAETTNGQRTLQDSRTPGSALRRRSARCTARGSSRLS